MQVDEKLCIKLPAGDTRDTQQFVKTTLKIDDLTAILCHT